MTFLLLFKQLKKLTQQLDKRLSHKGTKAIHYLLFSQESMIAGKSLQEKTLI